MTDCVLCGRYARRYCTWCGVEQTDDRRMVIMIAYNAPWWPSKQEQNERKGE